MDDKEFKELEDRYVKARENRRIIKKINSWQYQFPNGFNSTPLPFLIEDGILDVLSDKYINNFLAGIYSELIRQQDLLKEN